MAEFKSQYELLMEELKKEGKVKDLTPEESQLVAKEITTGYDQFILVQNKRNKEAQKALSNFSLNA